MNRYAHLSPDALEEHFSNYLVDSWSYSAVACFARNEKAFEMQYIYREQDKNSFSSVAGSAYHAALAKYFEGMKGGAGTPTQIDLTNIAYAYIDAVEPSHWKLTEKVNTVEGAIAETTTKMNKLLANFASELSIYTDDIDEVLAVEERVDEWVVVNGVDIPLPLHGVVDLVVRTKDDKIVIIDHKGVGKFTPESEIALVRGQQAITYAIAWESKTEMPVDEVWFIENKDSANKDQSPQLRKSVIVMDTDSHRLYEALLYEPLRRMLEAVSDPDYIYTINKDDNFVDKATLYDFWARTQISEIEDFPQIPENKKDIIAKRQRKIKDSSIGAISPKIITQFRKAAASFIAFDYAHSNMTPQEKIEHILRTHNVKVSVAHVIDGFSCITYLCDVAPGTEILSIFRHQLDIAYALDVKLVRVAGTLAMYEGKSYVAIEVNKPCSETLLWDEKYLEGHRLPIGLDNFRRPIVWDLDNNTTPHALVCGATGSGKSVMLISTLRYALKAGITDIRILDPKYEFIDLDLPDSVSVFNEIPDIEAELARMVVDMNDRIRARQKHFTLVIFDEFADANDQSRTGKALAEGEKSLQENFKLLLQKGRSCGFRFIAATQRADTKTINGTTKANLPVQICFRVPKGIDSKVVIDTEGAEQLAGNGDGLIHSPQYNDGLVRFQGFYYPKSN